MYMESSSVSELGEEEEEVPDEIICDLDGIICYPTDKVGDDQHQLTLSYCGQLYVFDNVTTDKVHKVFLLLGGCEFPSQPNQIQTDFEYSARSTSRAASLNRFRQKRKERCFEKKIRYNVRQQVALRFNPNTPLDSIDFRMNRKKGQFVTYQNSNESGEAEGTAGQDDENSVIATCVHCATLSKDTPMMRRGPAGPRTLCNACGLFWANKTDQMRNRSFCTNSLTCLNLIPAKEASIHGPVSF